MVFDTYLVSIDAERRKHNPQESFCTNPEIVGVDAAKIDSTTLFAFLTPRAQFDYCYARHDHRTIATKGAVGCYFSHVRVWKKIAEKGITGLVFEDDACLSGDKKNSHAWLQQVRLVSASSKGCVCFLGQMTLDNASFGTHAYCINPQGARNLLRNCYPIEMQIDAYMRTMAVLGVIQNLKCPENFFVQKSSLDTSEKHFKTSTQRTRQRTGHYASQPPGNPFFLDPRLDGRPRKSVNSV